jgi:branched-chain amino acid transport system ATP-binding protein
VDLDVRRGAFTALVGPAGAGKSVTLACISGALKPSGGRIRYFGYEIKGRGQERVARLGVVRTHQRAELFSGLTVLETATIGALLRRPRVAHAQAHAREMLALTGLAERAAVPVDALDELDRRRLEIARALATDPQMLLLDDPWEGLDAAGSASLLALLGVVRASGTTLVAATRSLSHLPSYGRASLVDDVVEIDRGKTAGLEMHAPVDLRA